MIAQGSYGSVTFAFVDGKKAMKSPVAIKSVIMADDCEAQMTMNEVQTLQAFQHKNLMELHHAFYQSNLQSQGRSFNRVVLVLPRALGTLQDLGGDLSEATRFEKALGWLG